MTSTGASASTGASTSDGGRLHETRMRLLEQVTTTGTGEGDYAPSRLADGLPGPEQTRMWSALEDLESAGLLRQRVGGTLADDHWAISPAGRAALDERASLRSNVTAMNRQCRLAIARWLYASLHNGTPSPQWRDFTAANGNDWYGQPFSDQAIKNASLSLHEQGLIRGTKAFGGGVPRPTLSAEGERWVEDTDAPQAPVSGPATTATGGPSFNFYAPANFQAAFDSPGSTLHQTVDQTITADQRQVLLERLDGVEAALALASLPDDEDVRATVAEAREEVTKEAPDRGRIAALAQRMVDAAASAIGTAVGTATGNVVVTGTVAGFQQAADALASLT